MRKVKIVKPIKPRNDIDENIVVIIISAGEAEDAFSALKVI